MKEFVRLYAFSKNLRKYYIAIFVLSVSIAVLAQAWPLLLRQIIDSISTNSAFDGEIFVLFSLMFA